MSKPEKSGLSVRINLANGGKLGPGKASLLDAIRTEGSIARAAEALSMSYPRALKLIEELNRDFAKPVITSSHGGASRGGSSLTETGERVLQLYWQACDAADAATHTAQDKLTRLQSSK